jgi:uncharacterized protein
VQTALVQDEALKRANARMEELQAQLDGGQQTRQQGGFLDSMREAVLGRREPRGSVPNVRSPATQTSAMAPPAYEGGFGYPPQTPTGPAFGSGGSFLGTAASTAAGVIGGALLMDGIRSMFGHHAGPGAATQNRSDAWTTIELQLEPGARSTAAWRAKPASTTSIAAPPRTG